MILRWCLLAVTAALVTTSPFEASATTGGTQTCGRVVGYYAAWSVYARNYFVTDLPAANLTHINYAFADIVNGQIALADPWADVQMLYPGDVWGQPLAGNFLQLQILKASHPHLKTLISVGGWTLSGGFSAAASTATSRATFATSCVQFMVQYQFDGIDLDWEFPVTGGLQPGMPADKQNFTLLLQEIRAQLDAQEVIDGREYLLTAAIPGDPIGLQNYELSLIHQYVDWLNLMTYNYHGWWSSATNFEGPLYHSGAGPTGFDDWNAHGAVTTCLGAGIPADKLHIGLHLSGWGWEGVPNTNNGLHQTFTGIPQGTWGSGRFDYSDLMDNYVTPATRHWHALAQAPWYYDPQTGIMITYEDSDSVSAKANYVLANNLGGLMFWECSADDDSHTLINTMHNLFASSVPASDFVRGDTNNDGVHNLADPIFLLSFLFSAQVVPMACEDAGDLNDDGELNLIDPIVALNALFGTGSFPGPHTCGPDPTTDPVDCGPTMCP